MMTVFVSFNFSFLLFLFKGNGRYLYDYFLVLGVLQIPECKRRVIKQGTLKFKICCCTFYLLWLIQKELDDIVSALGVVEEDKKGPVNEPCPLLERLKRGGDGLDGTKIGIKTRREEWWKRIKEPQRRKTKKVKFNIWFAIVIEKLSCSLVSTKRDNLSIMPPTWPSITNSQPLYTQIQVPK